MGQINEVGLRAVGYQCINNLPHFTVINGIVTETQKIILMLKLGQKVKVLVT